MWIGRSTRTSWHSAHEVIAATERATIAILMSGALRPAVYILAGSGRVTVKPEMTRFWCKRIYFWLASNRQANASRRICDGDDGLLSLGYLLQIPQPGLKVLPH
jgi:hypothetical protein